MNDTCRKGNTYPAQSVIIDRFKTTSDLVDHLEGMEGCYWEAFRKSFAQVTKYGTITQVQVPAYRVKHTFDSLKKRGCLNHKKWYLLSPYHSTAEIVTAIIRNPTETASAFCTLVLA